MRGFQFCVRGRGRYFSFLSFLNTPVLRLFFFHYCFTTLSIKRSGNYLLRWQQPCTCTCHLFLLDTSINGIPLENNHMLTTVCVSAIGVLSFTCFKMFSPHMSYMNFSLAIIMSSSQIWNWNINQSINKIERQQLHHHIRTNPSHNCYLEYFFFQRQSIFSLCVCFDSDDKLLFCTAKKLKSWRVGAQGARL